ncbi:efflux RND transporter periplasmic adaptor subunit [Litoribacillus peritrichatus]|uniref:Efflux RND transporter periplasmic adaptor subunit n=1 Tax=Litoribacillus peritrichatus TaxID=718191 RepID=A0ABP7MC60_9GAMM
MKSTLPIFMASLLFGMPAISNAGAGHGHQEANSSSLLSEESKHEESEHSENEKHESEEHDSHGHEESSAEDEEGVELTKTQQNLANIQVETLVKKNMAYQLYAPGEIRTNGYTSYLVSPRVDSVILKRHVALGDHVEQGQPLVTLFSETIAEAQADHRVDSAEWQRVQKLGRKTVGDKRYVEAQAAFEASYGRLLAFGLSEAAIKQFSNKTLRLGEYTLNAETEGAVLSDDFNQGQRVTAGESLIELANESELWVEARFSPNNQMTFAAGTLAEVEVDGVKYSARVSEEAHTIDPVTRTRVVRLLVDNEAHRLHPGMFADVFFTFKTKNSVLAIPESALMRSADGDWTLFIEHQPDRFEAKEVELGRSLGEFREITGIESGSKVVTEGAFFVASEIAKGGFDPHNH